MIERRVNFKLHSDFQILVFQKCQKHHTDLYLVLLNTVGTSLIILGSLDTQPLPDQTHLFSFMIEQSL